MLLSVILVPQRTRNCHSSPAKSNEEEAGKTYLEEKCSNESAGKRALRKNIWFDD